MTSGIIVLIILCVLLLAIPAANYVLENADWRRCTSCGRWFDLNTGRISRWAPFCAEADDNENIKEGVCDDCVNSHDFQH